MPQVDIIVNGRAFSVACEEGEEERVRALGDMIGQKVEALIGQLGQVGEMRLLFMASLLFADELTDQAGNPGGDSALTLTHKIESAAARIEDIVARLGND